MGNTDAEIFTKVRSVHDDLSLIKFQKVGIVSNVKSRSVGKLQPASPQISLRLSMETVIESTENKHKQLRAKTGLTVCPPRPHANKLASRALTTPRAAVERWPTRSIFNLVFRSRAFFLEFSLFSRLEFGVPASSELVCGGFYLIYGGFRLRCVWWRGRFCTAKEIALCSLQKKKTVSKVLFYLFVKQFSCIELCLRLDLNGMLFVTKSTYYVYYFILQLCLYSYLYGRHNILLVINVCKLCKDQLEL